MNRYEIPQPVRRAGFEYRPWRHFGCASTAGPNPSAAAKKRVNVILPYPVSNSDAAPVEDFNLKKISP
jgi:hypothetical protein